MKGVFLTLIPQHPRTVKLNSPPINGAISTSNTVSKPTKERTEDPEFIKGPNLKLEAIRETAKELRVEDSQEEAEDLRLKALEDRIRDVEREVKIEQLEAGDNLLNEVNQDTATGTFAQGGWHSDRKKIKTPAKDDGWFSKPARAQRKILQKKIGSYRPEPDDPISQRPRAKGVAEGSLFDLHPLSRVRIRDVEATSTIRAAKPAPLPVKPVHPGAAEEPIPGRCWECYTPLRKRDRAGTKFCTDNMGECRKTYNAREADRAERARLWKEWDDSQHEKRMLSVHRAAAEAMYLSALRCGIKEGTFQATADGVLAVHTKPLPPLNPQALVSVDDEVGSLYAIRGFGVQHISGSNYHEVEVVATATATGTLFEFKLPCRPEGTANHITLGFEGDPGPEWRSRPDLENSGRTSSLPTHEPPPPPMSAMYAAYNGRTAEYLATRKRGLGA
jgi:hypothetical protein